MRIRVSHETTYRYQAPPTGVIQTLRMTPRAHDGQFVVDWRIEVSEDCRLDLQEDAFGNITHAFSADGPVAELKVRVDGEVETQDTHGLVRGAVERFPPGLFLRETALTRPDPAILAFAESIGAHAQPDLETLHALAAELYGQIVYDTDPTHAATTAAEAFALRRGVCQDLAHIFIAAARSVGIPSRYIGGFLCRSDGIVVQEAGHAWVESFVPELGWVAFDPTNGVCATEAYVRVAAGLDYLGAAPVRGAHLGGGGEALTVSVHVDQAMRQAQN